MPGAQQVCRLPFAYVRAAIDVQHLPGNVWCFRQEHDRISDFLSVRDTPHGGQRAQKVFWIVFMQRRIDFARSDGIEANAFFRIFHRQVLRDGLDATFGDHRHGSRHPSEGVIRQRGGDAHHTAPRVLPQHLRDDELAEIDETVEVGRKQLPDVFRRLLRKCLDKVYPRIVYQRVDAAESFDSRFRDLLGRARLANIAVNQCKLPRRLKARFLHAARGGDHGIPALDKGLYEARTNALTGTWNNGCFTRFHRSPPLLSLASAAPRWCCVWHGTTGTVTACARSPPRSSQISAVT